MLRKQPLGVVAAIGAIWLATLTGVAVYAENISLPSSQTAAVYSAPVVH